MLSLIIATPTWQIPKLVPKTLASFSEKSNHFAFKERPIKGSSKPTASLIQNPTMQLPVWVVSGSVWQRKEYQQGLQTLLSHQEERVLSQLTHRPRISRLADVLNNTLIQFDVIWTRTWTFLPFCLSQDMNIGQYVHIGQQFQLSITILREDLLESTRRLVLLLQVCSIIDHFSLNITLSGMFSWC